MRDQVAATGKGRTKTSQPEPAAVADTLWTMSTDASAGTVQAVAVELRQPQPSIGQGHYTIVTGRGTRDAAPEWLRDLAAEMSAQGYPTDLEKGS